MIGNISYIATIDDIYIVGISPTVKTIKEISAGILIKSNCTNNVIIVDSDNKDLYKLLIKLMKRDIDIYELLMIYYNLSDDLQKHLSTLIEKDIIRINYLFAKELSKNKYHLLANTNNSLFLIYNGFSLIINKAIFKDLINININIPKEFVISFRIPDGFPKHEILMIEIALSNLCNLNCKYCYVRKDEAVISKKTLDNIAVFVNDIKSKMNRPITIQFFGGEPLLHFDLIEYFINSFKKYNS
jgi:uncharacterized radical SAM superfamily Fe-S cluster-containing enzyme